MKLYKTNAAVLNANIDLLRATTASMDRENMFDILDIMLCSYINDEGRKRLLSDLESRGLFISVHHT